MNETEKINYRFAQEKDHPQMEELYNSSPMDASLDILFAKNPSFIRANGVKGYEVKTAIAEIGGEIIAAGTRSLSNNYINGIPGIMGYLSDLRISSKKVFKKRVLADFYLYFYNLMGRGQAGIHIMSILEDNRKAKAALTWNAKHNFIPNAVSLGLINTYFIFPLFKKKTACKYKIKRYEDEDLENIVEFLNKEGGKRNLFPAVSADYFKSLPGFCVKDFLIAYEGSRIAGVMGKWNQSSFRQLILNSYKNKFKILKWLPFFPKEKKEIRMIYVSFAAVQNDNPAVFKELLTEFYNAYKKEGAVVLSLHENDPFNNALNGFIKYVFKSRLYACDYKPAEELNKILDSRPVHVEAGLL